MYSATPWIYKTSIKVIAAKDRTGISLSYRRLHIVSIICLINSLSLNFEQYLFTKIQPLILMYPTVWFRQ